MSSSQSDYNRPWADINRIKAEVRIKQLETALRELYDGMMNDRMPGQALLDWHARYPWAAEIVDR